MKVNKLLTLGLSLMAMVSLVGCEKPVDPTPMVEENEDVIRCPYCGTKDIDLVEANEYVCKVCGKSFNLENEHKEPDAEDAPAETADGVVDDGNN